MADRAAILGLSMVKLNRAFYKEGGKLGKNLTWQIKQLEPRERITCIVNDNGETIADTREINKELEVYYTNLYKSQIKCGALRKHS